LSGQGNNLLSVGLNFLFDFQHDSGDLLIFLLKGLLASFDLLSVVINLGFDVNLLSEFLLGIFVGFLGSGE
jgi:hypothetical protein